MNTAEKDAREKFFKALHEKDRKLTELGIWCATALRKNSAGHRPAPADAFRGKFFEQVLQRLALVEDAQLSAQAAFEEYEATERSA